MRIPVHVGRCMMLSVNGLRKETRGWVSRGKAARQRHRFKYLDIQQLFMSFPVTSLMGLQILAEITGIL